MAGVYFDCARCSGNSHVNGVACPDCGGTGCGPLRCSCEMWDDGNGESGPHLVIEYDALCPQHGRKADPESWAFAGDLCTEEYLMAAFDTAREQQEARA